MEKLLLTRNELAELCGIHPNTVSLWVRQNKLPSKMPGTNRWNLFEVESFLNNNKPVTTKIKTAKKSADEYFDDWKNARH